MAEQDEGQGGAPDGSQPESKTGGEPKTYSADHVHELREESKQRRLEIKALREEIAALKAAGTNGNSAELAERLKKIETERDEERKAAAAAKHEALKLEIGAELNLPPKLAKVLVGTTAEELRAHAEELKPLIAVPEPDGQRRPRPNTTPAPGGAPVAETDVQKRARLFGGGRNPFD